MKKLFVTGAGGMVGAYVRDVFQEWDLALTDIVPGTDMVDVRDPASVRDAIGRTKPDVVLHLAAATDVDRCEREPGWAQQSNAMGTENVVAACREGGAVLVYVSTGAVFGGDKTTPYVESDAPGAVNVYGRAKLAGERAVTAGLTRYFIARAGWMMGGGPRDTKFVGKITELIAAGRSPLRAVSDTWGTPTYARDLLGAVKRLVATNAFGLYHVGNAGSATRYDMALAIRDVLDRRDVIVERVDSSAFPLPAPRPRSEAIECRALRHLGITPRPWRDALRDYVTTELAPRLQPS